jgi:phage head maturation protease
MVLPHLSVSLRMKAPNSAGVDAFMGRLAFNQTAEGRNAEGMVARGEIAGISAGYRVEEWEAQGKSKDRRGTSTRTAYRSEGR